jgi:hypothetical protein
MSTIIEGRDIKIIILTPRIRYHVLFHLTTTLQEFFATHNIQKYDTYYRPTDKFMSPHSITWKDVSTFVKMDPRDALIIDFISDNDKLAFLKLITEQS